MTRYGGYNRVHSRVEARGNGRKRESWRATQNSRQQVLRCLGFANYPEYLASPLWRAIRKIQLGKFPLCCCCGSQAVLVHHRNYKHDTLRYWLEGSLASMCEACHTAIHTSSDGGMVTLKETEKRLEERMKGPYTLEPQTSARVFGASPKTDAPLSLPRRPTGKRSEGLSAFTKT